MQQTYPSSPKIRVNYATKDNLTVLKCIICDLCRKPVGCSDGDDDGESDGTLVGGDVGDSVGVILGKEVGEVDG